MTGAAHMQAAPRHCAVVITHHQVTLFAARLSAWVQSSFIKQLKIGGAGISEGVTFKMSQVR